MYTKAIENDPTDHVFYSNRSGCSVALRKYADSLSDAKQCIFLKPDWFKGYLRKAQVYEAQKKWR
jgi:stress-induced-phosphoprotein 1